MDKHSTGGVGDKSTLVVVPIVAACGVKVAKMSGRGLGHTGGTIDKLESIQGYNTNIDRQKFVDIVNRVGASIISQSGDMVPADKKMYALRDVTATIDSMPLIVSSIMSKKIAAGADAIVLDVKVGSGGFNKNYDFAKKLAQQMVTIGKSVGRKVTAFLTDMDTPLAKAVGNSLEVVEAINTLKGKGEKDLEELSIALSSEMLYLAGVGSRQQCEQKARQALYDGSALKTFVNMVSAHGANTAPIFDTDIFPSAAFDEELIADKNGYIIEMDTEKIGTASLLLGAGRAKKDDDIDYLSGITICKKTGDYVTNGEVLAKFYYNDHAKIEHAKTIYLDSLTFGENPPTECPLLIERISSEDKNDD